MISRFVMQLKKFVCHYRRTETYSFHLAPHLYFILFIIGCQPVYQSANTGHFGPVISAWSFRSKN